MDICWYTSESIVISKPWFNDCVNKIGIFENDESINSLNVIILSQCNLIYYLMNVYLLRNFLIFY